MKTYVRMKIFEQILAMAEYRLEGKKKMAKSCLTFIKQLKG